MEWIFETYVSKFLHVAGKALRLRVSFEVDVKTESITTNRTDTHQRLVEVNWKMMGSSFFASLVRQKEQQKPGGDCCSG